MKVSCHLSCSSDLGVVTTEICRVRSRSPSIGQDLDAWVHCVSDSANCCLFNLALMYFACVTHL